MQVDEAAVLLGAHPHGYLLLVGDARGAAPPDCRGWRAMSGLLPGSTLHLQPRTVLGHARGPLHDRDVVLLGHPVDVAAGLTDPTEVAGRLATTWARSGSDALVREVADLGGRWTLLAGRRASPDGDAVAPDARGRTDEPVELLVVPDTHATQPVHVGGAARGAAVASAPALVAGALGLDPDERALELLDLLRERRSGRVTYLPGLRTAYLGVEALVPNSLLRLRLDAAGLEVGQRRFWPFRPRVATEDVDAVYAAFRERFTAHVELLAGLGRPAVSLTGGLDSRVTAAVAAPALRAVDGFAFTYLNPRDAARSRAAVEDVTVAREAARALGLPHRVLRWRQPPAHGTFDVLHRRTYAPQLPSRGAAHAMWADLPRDLVQLQSNGGETGTTFVRHRPEHVLTPRRLTELYLGSGADVDDALVGELYGDYLDRVPMHADALLGFDDYDVLYWEQRMGRWGWQKFVDGDFGHRILLPFNDRVLLETMLSLPYPLRRDRALFERLLADAGVRHLPGEAPATVDATPSRTRATGGPGPRSLRTGARRLRRAVGRRVGSHRGPAATAGTDRSPAPHEPSPGAGARSFAVLPSRWSGRPPGGLRRHPLPGRRLSLWAHPGLPRAVTGDASAWVLVVGDPVDVPDGLDDAADVARLLHRLLAHGAGLGAATGRAAALCGSWTVVLAGPQGGRVVTDPLPSSDLRVCGGGTMIVGDPALAAALGAGEGEPLGADRLAQTPPAGPRTWRTGALPVLHAQAAAQGADAERRLAAHVALLARRGRPVLGLDAGADLLALAPALGRAAEGSAGPGAPVEAVTWWHPADGDSTRAMISSGDRALRAGVDQRLVLVDDADPVEVARALDRAVPADAVLWLGHRPGAATDRRTRALLAALPPTRRVALPWSDRLLPLLPGGALE
ncbi:hypothetical protein AVL62_14300 [Serinicoccus chungangensis]|uniref:Asparagine synthetase domain-containing protein n=1 Tax=Serinicoccus chungangensis TaxID=767452 RepID=A0A0W8I433_9MICO|nr:hypothetical protein [Serinicoccus chungangensis]KUG52492.1 hypothetical protein AVL62_14300 [Serinicoccus chungangensis]